LIGVYEITFHDGLKLIVSVRRTASTNFSAGFA
jgi:hypothetical protein